MSGSIVPDRNHRLVTGPWLPAAVLRAVPLVLGLAIAMLVTDITMWRVIAVAIGVGAVVLPGLLLIWVLPGVVAVATLMAEPAWPTTALAVLLIHLCQVVGTLTSVLEPRGRVVLAALWPTARRFLVVQLIAQLLAAGATLLLQRASAGGSAMFAVVAGLALVGLTCLLLWLISLRDRQGVGELWRRQL